MKLTKKKVLVAAIAICLIATLSMGTLAWFFDTDSITNQFQIADSLTSFEIDVWEEVPGTNGQLVELGHGPGDHSYTYEDATPGKKFDKVLHVENTSDNELADQYVKVELTFTRYSVLNAMGENPETVALDCCEAMLLGANFSANADDTTTAFYYSKAETKYHGNTDTITYVFYLRSILTSEDGSVTLFEKVQIPESMDINDAALLQNGGFEIKAVAYAIQSANIKAPTNAGDPEPTVLQNAMYAFGAPWTEAQTQTSPAVPPVIPTVPLPDADNPTNP